MLVVERMDAVGAPMADCLVAIGTADAGAGDRVLVFEEGNGARQVFASKDAPVRSVIVGIVDAVTASWTKTAIQRRLPVGRGPIGRIHRVRIDVTPVV